jgi:hypothetical protein
MAIVPIKDKQMSNWDDDNAIVIWLGILAFAGLIAFWLILDYYGGGLTINQ